jgi:hypothetical protein
MDVLALEIRIVEILLWRIAEQGLDIGTDKNRRESSLALKLQITAGEASSMRQGPQP